MTTPALSDLAPQLLALLATLPQGDPAATVQAAAAGISSLSASLPPGAQAVAAAVGQVLASSEDAAAAVDAARELVEALSKSGGRVPPADSLPLAARIVVVIQLQEVEAHHLGQVSAAAVLLGHFLAALARAALSSVTAGLVPA